VITGVDNVIFQDISLSSSVISSSDSKTDTTINDENFIIYY